MQGCCIAGMLQHLSVQQNDISDDMKITCMVFLISATKPFKCEVLLLHV